jgi:hypothetical protein
MIKIFERDWGLLVLDAQWFRFDFLPRLTLMQIPHMVEISLGLACFRLRLSIWSKEMREFNKKYDDTL